MPTQGRTGVVIPVPAADDLLCGIALRHPGAVREGVLAHLSLLYPFLPAEQLDERVTGALAGLFAEQQPLAVKFRECGRRRDFVYLSPDPSSPIADLAARVQQEWPELVPYAGAYEIAEPHLTLAMHTSEQTASEIEEEVAEELPISVELSAAWLVAFDGQWTVRERFPFRAV
jgi:hypothetical protein